MSCVEPMIRDKALSTEVQAEMNLSATLRLSGDGRRVHLERHELGGTADRPEGRIRRWFHQAKAKVEDFRRRGPKWVRASLDWLNRRRPHDEPLWMRLRLARDLEVLYPETMDESQASQAWASIVSDRRRRHMWGLGIYLVLLPLSIPLIALPGPNVIGLWLAFRVVCHGLALAGIARVRSLMGETRFAPQGVRV